jgi:pimeloyl-ACP methyl ester carboxylesterase
MVVSLMRLLPAWTRLKGVAHTLPYDMRIMGDTQGGKPLPADRWAAVTVPTLVIDGGKSPHWMRNGMQALADVLPNAEHRTLAGQTHLVKAKALAPVLTEFFTKQGAS